MPFKHLAADLLQLLCRLRDGRREVHRLGGAVQVEPIKPALKAPGIKLLKLKYDKPLSNFAFKFQLAPLHLGGITVVAGLLHLPDGAVLEVGPPAAHIVPLSGRWPGREPGASYCTLLSPRHRILVPSNWIARFKMRWMTWRAMTGGRPGVGGAAAGDHGAAGGECGGGGDARRGGGTDPGFHAESRPGQRRQAVALAGGDVPGLLGADQAGDR
jgi:hypothetical protein